MVLWIFLFFFAFIIELRIAYIVLGFSLCLAGEDCRADAKDGCALLDGNFVV